MTETTRRARLRRLSDLIVQGNADLKAAEAACVDADAFAALSEENDALIEERRVLRLLKPGESKGDYCRPRLF